MDKNEYAPVLKSVPENNSVTKAVTGNATSKIVNSEILNRKDLSVDTTYDIYDCEDANQKTKQILFENNHAKSELEVINMFHSSDFDQTDHNQGLKMKCYVLEKKTPTDFDVDIRTSHESSCEVAHMSLDHWTIIVNSKSYKINTSENDFGTSILQQCAETL